MASSLIGDGLTMAERLPLLPLSAAGLGIVGAFSVPTVVTIARQIRKGAPKDNFYEDRDGKATPESIAAFSNRIPRAAILLFASLGLATSISISVLTTLDAQDGLFLENWMVTASWVRILAWLLKDGINWCRASFSFKHC